MLRKLLAPVFAMGILTTISAQDSTETTSLSVTGSVDVYYKYDFGKTRANNFTSFTNSHNRVEPGMASIQFGHHTGKIAVMADLGFGKRATEFSYNDQGILSAVKQLYISYAPSRSLKFTAGSWATHVGYELADPQLNRNYSMSYMFTNGPFFHTGVKADVSFGNSGLMLGLANPTDYKYVPDGVLNKKFILAQYSYAPGDFFKFYLNYVGGKTPDTSKTKQFDVVMTSRLGDKFSIGFDGTINIIQNWNGKENSPGRSWWGSALYFNVDPASSFGLTLRSEYFSDKNQLKIYTGSTEGARIFANTLSANFRLDNLLIIPEFRVDHSSQQIFLRSDGTPASTAANYLLAAVYSF